ncbi:MAG TPA: hypothetical protein VH157_06965 [Bryobacteraceae bacterium]|nr:hypothetical protein [Bryobacteraceae bacterium]
MALTKLQFQPGIFRESTEYANSGGWYDCDKVRFRRGNPEKIGGWKAVIQTSIEGVCRHIHQWSSVEYDFRLVGLGTSSHLYILWSEDYYDITPVRATITSLANPFTTGAVGGNQLTVNATAHQANMGDYVVFSGVTTAVDVFTPQVLNAQFQVIYVPDANHFIIEPPGTIVTAGATGGGPSVTVTFLIHSGADDATVGQGWGIPPWNSSSTMPANWQVGWGEPFDPTQIDPANPTINQLRIWDLDNFGEDLVANVRGGPIYYWHRASGLATRAANLTQAVTVGGTTFTPVQAPTTASQVLVSPNDRHLIAMGCDWPETGVTVPDTLLVRWSSEEEAYTWQPLRTNSAGSQRLSAGSFIISAMRTRQEILIWTDLGLWSMKYIGSPYFFGFDSIAEGLSIVGPNACINVGSMVLWMDRGIFYVYTGQIQELPCAVKDYIFSDFNYLQGYKVYAGHNHIFSEAIWFYPSSKSQENDRYVIYNYVDQTWSIGTLERTAWLDMGRANYPVATDRSNSLLYYHEFGDDDNGNQLPAYIESSDLDNGGGDHYLLMGPRFIPDVAFRGDGGTSQTVGITILARSAPGKPKYAAVRLDVNAMTAEQYIRIRERQISFRIESEGLGVGWRLGTLRADLQPDGMR